MREFIIGAIIILGLWGAFSVVFLIGLYWTHYPHGRKGKRK